jgi:hypothetical protein
MGKENIGYVEELHFSKKLKNGRVKLTRRYKNYLRSKGWKK